MNLFDQDGKQEPAQQRRPKGLRDAYIQELTDRPPTAYFSGDTAAARRAREMAADKDIARLHAAAARMGLSIELVPLKK